MKYRKGFWSPEEDQKLRDYMLRDGHGCWSTRAVNARLQRNGKSCRLRWMNYLRPGLKHCAFSAEEEETVVSLHSKLGNQWSRIAQHLPGRTDNEVKNYWNTYLRKKQFLRTGGAKRQDDAPPPRKIMFVDCLDSAGASLMMAPAATPRAGGASDVGDLQPDLMMSRHHDQGPPVQVGGAVGSLRGSGLAGDGGGTCWDWEPDGMVDHMYMSVQGGGLWDLPSFSEFLESNYGEA